MFQERSSAYFSEAVSTVNSPCVCHPSCLSSICGTWPGWHGPVGWDCQTPASTSPVNTHILHEHTLYHLSDSLQHTMNRLTHCINPPTLHKHFNTLTLWTLSIYSMSPQTLSMNPPTWQFQKTIHTWILQHIPWTTQHTPKTLLKLSMNPPTRLMNPPTYCINSMYPPTHFMNPPTHYMKPPRFRHT